MLVQTAVSESVIDRMASALTSRIKGPVAVATIAVAALLVAVSGGIHLYLWHLAYQNVPTIGPLFIAQTVSAMTTAILMLVWRRGWAVVIGLGLMIGTMACFALALTTGLFGFKLTFWSGWAYLALVDEATATVLLGICAWHLWTNNSGTT
jgi:hypothetical protein